MRCCFAVIGVLLTGLCQLSACTTSEVHPAAAPPELAGATLPDQPAIGGLPALSDLRPRLNPVQGRASSYVPADLLQQGEAFETDLPHQRVTATAGGAAFEPNWRRATADPADLAYAMYALNVKGYGGQAKFYSSWIAAPPDWGDVYVALANWSKGGWDWFGLAADGTLKLPGLNPYVDFGGGLLACVVLIDTNSCELDWLRLGSLPPQVALSATPTFGITPATVEFDAAGSADLDGSIVEYQWDPEGDGTFSESTGLDPSFTFNYTTGGDIVAAVRVLDNSGVYAIETAEIRMRDEVTFSYGSPDFDEHAKSVLVNSEGQLMLFGSRKLHRFDEFVLVAVVDPGGESGIAYQWGEGDEELNRAVPGPEGFYACGSSGSYTTDNAGLLQLWSADGELAWSRTVTLADYSVGMWSLLVHAGQIYVCGHLYSSSLQRFFGLLCKFDSAGNFVWATTIIGPDDCTLRDIALSEPMGQPTLVVCGDYDTSETETEALYATYDLDGNQLSCMSWGRPGLSELAMAVSVAGVDSVPFVALRSAAQGQTSIVLSSPGAATTELYRPGLDMHLYDLHGTSLLATCALGLSGVSAIAVRFSTGLEFEPAIEISAIPDGSVFGVCNSKYGAARVVSGSQRGPLPTTASVELVSQVPPETWINRVPSQGSPNQFVVSTVTALPSTPAGFEFNRQPTGEDDLIVHLSR